MNINFTSYIKPALLALIPFLNGIATILKGVLKEENPNAIKSWIRKALKDTGNLPLWIFSIGVLVAIVFGLITSTFEGWRYFVDAIFCTGIIQGGICSMVSMGVYDTYKAGGRK